MNISRSGMLFNLLVSKGNNDIPSSFKDLGIGTLHASRSVGITSICAAKLVYLTPLGIFPGHLIKNGARIPFS